MVPLFVVVGSVVVVVLGRDVGVMVWWGSWCVVVRWSSCGDVVVVVIVVGSGDVADVGGMVVVNELMKEGGAHHDNIARNDEQ